MKTQQIENLIRPYPISQYRICETEEICFTEKVRYICENECSRYKTSWACPPAVGEVEQCREKCMVYPYVLFFTTLAEVTDIENIEETLQTRIEHEKIVENLEEAFTKAGLSCMALSSESCEICECCTYPREKCRHPNRMHPCIESYGILVTELAEKCGMEFFYGGNIVSWFGMIFFGEKTE